LLLFFKKEDLPFMSTATLAYQDDLDRITAERPPRALRFISAALGLLIVTLIGVAAVTRLDIIITGRGRLAADHPTALLQPLDRAIIRTLQVRAGDAVKKGQVLATLDPTFAAADLAALLARQRALAAEMARLQAEADGYEYVPGAGVEAALQAGLFAQRQREYAARLASFDEATQRDEAARATVEGQRRSLAAQVAIAQDVMTVRQTLMRGAIGSRLQYLDADAGLSHATGELRTATDRLNELAHDAASHRADRTAFVEKWRRDILESLAARREALAEADGAVAKAAHLRDLAAVTAPEDGVVLEVAPRAPGSVLRDAEPLLTLLPAHAGLQAELTIRSADIGYIREGDPVTLKVDAYPYQRHGALHGRVRSITAASFEADASHPGDALAGAAVHRVLVNITSSTLEELPPGTGPIPGMTLSGDVRVGTRSVLAYFLAPITRGFRQSFHEP
jgi:HlyD family secretion protein